MRSYQGLGSKSIRTFGLVRDDRSGPSSDGGSAGLRSHWSESTGATGAEAGEPRLGRSGSAVPDPIRMTGPGTATIGFDKSGFDGSLFAREALESFAGALPAKNARVA